MRPATCHREGNALFVGGSGHMTSAVTWSDAAQFGVFCTAAVCEEEWRMTGSAEGARDKEPSGVVKASAALLVLNCSAYGDNKHNCELILTGSGYTSSIHKLMFGEQLPTGRPGVVPPSDKAICGGRSLGLRTCVRRAEFGGESPIRFT